MVFFPADDVPITDMTLDQFQNTIQVNLTGSFLFAKEFMIHLKQRKDCQSANIVIIGSTSGLFGEAGHIDYSSSKSALMYGFTKSLKNEITQIVPRGRVNVVAPGWVKTPMAEKAMKDEVVVTKVLQTVATRKVATAEDVARSVVFLSSDLWSGHVSGDILEVTGGMEGRLLYEKDAVKPFV
eukprot:TRINITY_DN5008_c0_g1_i1.p1 TRINITY_DN5008_c0_g1~~TRINITY_DN5008_c0_g1_i1.p1  ORF type:complete len:182 (-),score=47.80 TRINITY_DN5008_c0_g1_i1:16-561(-)